MPIQWTLANERLLFLRVLDSHKGSIDYKWISETWPNTNPNERPTARAVSEHIFKLRKLAKPDAGNDTATSTPKTPRAKAPPRASGNTGSTEKKRVKRKLDDTESSPERTFTPINKKRVKNEENDEMTSSEMAALQDTPSKRARRPVEHFNMANYAEDGTDGEESLRFSSADPEYAPAEEAEESKFQMPDLMDY